MLYGGFLVSGGRVVLGEVADQFGSRDGKGRGKRDEKLLAFSNCWITFFPHITHLFKNGRKHEISKLDVRRPL